MVLLKNLPFHIGPMPTPKNPETFPNLQDFELVLNEKYIVLEQVIDKEKVELLKKSYQLGLPMGVPSDNSSSGEPYVIDFINFILENLDKTKGNILEIGSGSGYISKIFQEMGWKVTSLEPGIGYSQVQASNGVTVINDFYPSKKIDEKYDAIIFYTVLEHIIDLKSFFNGVKTNLKENGKIFLGVPDCTLELKEVNYSILLHEHKFYFNEYALMKVLNGNDFEAKISCSTYGRSLYAVAKKVKRKTFIHNEKELSEENAFILNNYINKIDLRIKKTKTNIQKLNRGGTLGIYCPGRLLNVLPLDGDYIFIDDAFHLQKKYFPPFNTGIIDRSILDELNIKTIIIGSDTFKDAIIRNLPTRKQFRIISIGELNEIS